MYRGLLMLYHLLEQEQKDKWKKGRAYSEMNSYEENQCFITGRRKSRTDSPVQRRGMLTEEIASAQAESCYIS